MELLMTERILNISFLSTNIYVYHLRNNNELLSYFYYKILICSINLINEENIIK